MKIKICFTFLLLFKLLFSQSNPIIFESTGALTHNSIQINARFRYDIQSVKAIINDDSTFTANNIPSSLDSAIENFNHRIVHLFANNLLPNKKYYYRFMINDSVVWDNFTMGSFTTPDTLNYSFKIVVSSCNQDNSKPIYTAIKNENPLFFLITGDWHYRDINSNNIQEYKNAFDSAIFNSSEVKKFLQSTPYDYVWDDHDYCGDNSGGSNLAGSENSKTIFRLYNPHYILPSDSSEKSIYHSFVIGRVKFIVSDLRSARTQNSMMGNEQKIWFKNQVLSAVNDNQFLVWVSSVSFYGNQTDNWGGYTDERIEISNFFKSNNVTNLLILCGDAHMLAIDDGSNGDFSDLANNSNRYPLLQSGAMRAFGSYKGGTYSHGYYRNPNNGFGQFSTINFIDQNDKICLEIIGKRMAYSNNAISNILNYSFCRDIPLNTNVKAKIFNDFIFPNPSKNRIFFRENRSDFNYKIYSAEGKLLNESIVNQTNSIDISNLCAGLYFLMINNKSIKLIVD